MELSQLEPIYFLGIGGTGMAAVAGLAQEAGYQIIGSDANLYPPMSTMLEELRIPVKTPYSVANLSGLNPQLVVIANALSRGHEELEEVIARRLPYQSFPQFLGETFLKNRVSVVVSGTHGKTTTTSLLAYTLEALGEDPGFLIGGIPRNFPRSFHLGTGPVFAIEGDEYDTAFFDKNSKFLHYHPKFLIFNNLEFDHADIFPNLQAIENQFEKLIGLVTDKSNIIANIDDVGVSRLLTKLGLIHDVRRVSTLGQDSSCLDRLLELKIARNSMDSETWQLSMNTEMWGNLTVETCLSGSHNAANMIQVVACLGRLCESEVIKRPSRETLEKILSGFKGVARRMDLLASVNGIDIFEDFAHHPTAIQKVLQGLRTAHPRRRILVAFEPKNATSRRNIFTEDFSRSLSLADLAFIGPCPVDLRIPEDQRMDTRVLVEKIGKSAKAFAENEDLLRTLADECKSGDLVIFMSSGSFSGIQYKLQKQLMLRFSDS